MIGFWRKIYAKHDNVKAYTLLSPALILVILAMARANGTNVEL